jgi:hypothetical protein
MPVRSEPRQRPSLDLDDQHRAVGQRHRTFGKSRAVRDDFHFLPVAITPVVPTPIPASFWAAADARRGIRLLPVVG